MEPEHEYILPASEPMQTKQVSVSLSRFIHALTISFIPYTYKLIYINSFSIFLLLQVRIVNWCNQPPTTQSHKYCVCVCGRTVCKKYEFLLRFFFVRPLIITFLPHGMFFLRVFVQLNARIWPYICARRHIRRSTVPTNKFD